MVPAIRECILGKLEHGRTRPNLFRRIGPDTGDDDAMHSTLAQVSSNMQGVGGGGKAQQAGATSAGIRCRCRLLFQDVGGGEDSNPASHHSGQAAPPTAKQGKSNII